MEHLFVAALRVKMYHKGNYLLRYSYLTLPYDRHGDVYYIHM